MEAKFSSEISVAISGLHLVMSQNTDLLMSTAVRISGPAQGVLIGIRSVA
jgi:hypothetical protein